MNPSMSGQLADVPDAVEPRSSDPEVTSSAEAKWGRLPSTLQCGCRLAAVRVALLTLGFDRTMQWIRRRVRAMPILQAPVEYVLAAERTVAMAAAFYPGHAACLERSLVLYHLLRRKGIDVRYCQGVQPHPFGAHAWIEYNGEPINDVPEHVRQFARLPDDPT